LRHDGGDGETGAGVELGGGLSFTDPSLGLMLEGQGRALLAHQGDYKEWGVSGLVRLDPGAQGEELSLSLQPAWGEAASGVDRLWEQGALDLVPGSAGSALDGVEVDDLTLVVVPPQGGGLKPDDGAVPEHIAANLKKVLTDAGKTQGYTLAADINLFAELELGGSQGMTDLMTFIGRDPKAGIPISGVMSRHLFDRKASAADRLKDMALDVPMPNLNLASLPGAFALSNTAFKIADQSPSGETGLWVGLGSIDIHASH